MQPGTLTTVSKGFQLRRGTVLAFDFGTKRIGVAIGEPMLGQARALTTITGEANDTRFAAIAKLIGEWRPRRGWPRPACMASAARR